MIQLLRYEIVGIGDEPETTGETVLVAFGLGKLAQRLVSMEPCILPPVDDTEPIHCTKLRLTCPEAPDETLYMVDRIEQIHKEMIR